MVFQVKGLGVAAVIIDRTHIGWFVIFVIGSAAALLSYSYFNSIEPNGVTGGTVAGMWFGIAGAGLIVFAMLLSGLRHVPKWWWIGQRQSWLRAHIWLGLLSGVLILCHSGFRAGGVVEKALWVVLALTLVTGVFGLFLQQILPRLITERVPCETPYEQIPGLCNRLRQEADLIVERVQQRAGLAHAVRSNVEAMYEREIRPFLAGHGPRRSMLEYPDKVEELFARVTTLPGSEAVKQELGTLQTFCSERRLLAGQERLYFWLHIWLYLHVPAAVALLLLGTVHAFLASFY